MTQAGWFYNAVSSTFWDDVKVRAWSEDGRMLALYLLTCPQRVTEGFYRLSVVQATDDLGWPAERFQGAMRELIDTDFADYDEEARLVLVVRALKYGPPIRGPKSTKGALNVLDKAKGSRRLFDRFLAAADRYEPDFAAEIRRYYGL